MTDEPTTTGRPRKAAAEKRTRRVIFRVSEEEWRAINATADMAGLSVSDYGRAMVLTGRVIAPPPRHEVLNRADFGRVGSNLNQIARHLNAGRAVDADAIAAAIADWREIAAGLK